MDPGTVIIIEFPGAVGSKARPAVVVSTATYHACRPDVILAIVTSDLSSSTEPTDYILEDWQAAGLRIPSAVRCFLATRPASEIRRIVGKLSDRDWLEVKSRLRLALAVEP